MEMIFRKANMQDLPQLMEIFAEAREFLAAQGVDQWQNGYPTESRLAEDIAAKQSYLLEDGGRIIASSVLQFAPEPSYEEIHEGEWGSAQKAACIHRITISAEYRGGGLGGQFMNHLIGTAKQNGLHYLQVDTHEDNLPMQKYLKKQGFTYRGIIYLKEEGAKRIAFDKTLDL